MYTNRKLHRLSLLFIAALFLTLAAAPASAGTTSSNNSTVLRIRTNGRAAHGFLGSSDGTTGYIYVAQDEIAGTVSLEFAYVTPHPTDPDLGTFYQGAGEIPNTAFITGETSAHLALTTPDSVALNTCIVNFITGEYTCAPGDPVTFDLSWVSDGIWSIHEKFHRHETYGPVKTKVEGEYTNLAALVSGTWSGAWGTATGSDLVGNLYDTEGKTFVREITMPTQP